MLSHETKLPAKKGCRHCGALFSANGDFCCAGCAAVFDFLTQNNLGHFYKLRPVSLGAPAKPAEIDHHEFRELDTYGEKTINVYLEGIHCLGCLWVLEKLPELHPGVVSSRLDLGTSVLRLKIDERTNFRGVLKTVQKLGYRPTPVKENLDALAARENRMLLARLGVAAAGAGNIMILAVSIYAGAEGKIARDFAWLSFLLALPVLSFSAYPIYREAISGLRRRILSVDLPIALALAAGFLTSFISLTRGQTEVYFDSLSMLVFLLLSSRYFLRRLRERGLRPTHLFDFLQNKEVLRICENQQKLVSIAQITKGDRIWIPGNTPLPCDGIIRSPSALLDMSLLTGEANPERVVAGEVAYAGVGNMGDGIELECTSTGAQTRLGQILETLRHSQSLRSPMATFADQVGRWFVVIVLSLAAIVLLTHYQNLNEGLERALALLIVTCPCVLAFAVPLSLSLSARVAAKQGILIQSPENLEHLANAKQIFLDKTGTLTNGEFQVISWISDAALDSEIRNAVYSLEKFSRHPIARSILRYLESSARTVSVENFTETLGFGVKGRIAGLDWSVSKDSLSNAKGNTLCVFREQQIVARLLLSDSPRPESISVVKKLAPLEVHLLTGDRREQSLALAKTLAIPPGNVHAEKSPEEKAEILAKNPGAVMVGDGFNDAIAFRQAAVGIAAHGSAEESLRNADIFFSRPGLKSLINVFAIARRNQKITRLNLFFSAAYNVIAGTFAILGLMTPLLAAVIMPISALTIFLITTFGIEGRNKK